MTTCLVALGANCGNRAEFLRRAVDLLRGHEKIDDIRVSRWHETRPVGAPDASGEFLNGCMRLETGLPSGELLDLLQRIEDDLGRRRDVRWGARTIDLDLLLYGDAVIDSPRLCVPHPWMAIRRFVLESAAEVGAEMIHPKIGWSVSHLLAHLNTAAPYVALTGTSARSIERIGEAVAGQCDWRFLRVPAGKARPASIAAVERETSLVAARAAELASAAVSDANRVISGFWIEQSLALAELSAEQQEALSHRFQTAQQTAPTPKLVILLRFTQDDESPASGNFAELKRRATRAGRGPFLLLNAVPQKQAVAEVLAALEAMD